MRAVLDTNVVVSAIFFRGVPGRVLEEWGGGAFELILTPVIFQEYQEVCTRLAVRFPGLEYNGVLSLILAEATLVADPPVGEPISADPDDDVFLRCAASAGAIIVSGDRHLLEVSGWNDVAVLQPAHFLARLEADQS